jgi:hypothetical protein
MKWTDGHSALAASQAGITNLVIPSQPEPPGSSPPAGRAAVHLKAVGQNQNARKRFCLVIFRVYEKTDTARHAEDLEKLLHRRNQQDFSEAAPLVVYGERQTPQTNPCHAARQFSRLKWRKYIRLDLAEIQRKKAQNGFGF